MERIEGWVKKAGISYYLFIGLLFVDLIMSIFLYSEGELINPSNKGVLIVQMLLSLSLFATLGFIGYSLSKSGVSQLENLYAGAYFGLYLGTFSTIFSLAFIYTPGAFLQGVSDEIRTILAVIIIPLMLFFGALYGLILTTIGYQIQKKTKNN